jgi:hypothetical protein
LGSVELLENSSSTTACTGLLSITRMVPKRDSQFDHGRTTLPTTWRVGPVFAGPGMASTHARQSLDELTGQGGGGGTVGGGDGTAGEGGGVVAQAVNSSGAKAAKSLRYIQS